MAPGAPHRGNTEQLRAAIDRGLTGDKVCWSDPAAAPLGADDEAAGTPPSAADVSAAHSAELRPDWEQRGPLRTSGAPLIIVGVIAVTAIAIIAGLQVP
jgi:hypothetical protein